MDAACFAHTYSDAVKILQYFGHFHVPKLRKVFAAAQKISAKGNLPVFSMGA